MGIMDNIDRAKNGDRVYYPLPGYDIFVGNLFRGCRTEWLVNEFKKYGPLVEARAEISKKSGRSGFECRGWGHVRFLNREDSEQAVEGHHGKVIKPPNNIPRTLRVLPADLNRTLFCAGMPDDWEESNYLEFFENKAEASDIEKIEIIQKETQDGPEVSTAAAQFCLLTFRTHEAALEFNNLYGIGNNIEASPNLAANPISEKLGNVNLKLPYRGVGGPQGEKDLIRNREGELVPKEEQTPEQRKARLEFVNQCKSAPKYPVPVKGRADDEELSAVDKARNAFWAVKGVICGTPPDLVGEPRHLLICEGTPLFIHFADPLRIHVHLNNGDIVSKLNEEQKEDLERRMAENRAKRADLKTESRKDRKRGGDSADENSGRWKERRVQDKDRGGSRPQRGSGRDRDRDRGGGSMQPLLSGPLPQQQPIFMMGPQGPVMIMPQPMSMPMGGQLQMQPQMMPQMVPQPMMMPQMMPVQPMMSMMLPQMLPLEQQAMPMQPEQSPAMVPISVPQVQLPSLAQSQQAQQQAQPQVQSSGQSQQVAAMSMQQQQELKQLLLENQQQLAALQQQQQQLLQQHPQLAGMAVQSNQAGLQQTQTNLQQQSQNSYKQQPQLSTQTKTSFQPQSAFAQQPKLSNPYSQQLQSTAPMSTHMTMLQQEQAQAPLQSAIRRDSGQGQVSMQQLQKMSTQAAPSIGGFQMGSQQSQYPSAQAPLQPIFSTQMRGFRR